VKTVRIYILIATLALVGRSVWAFDCITVFGDSLSDTGNFSLFTGGSFPPAPPYYGGPDPTFPVGRFSNGKVWVEYLADLLDVADPVPRGFEIDPTIEPISPCDTNYAWAGAVTGSEAASFTPTLAPYPSPPLPPPPVTGGLPDGLQIESYLLDFDYFCPESLECDLDDYLFIVWAGANDILIDVDSDVKTSVANLEKHLDDLINDGGAKHILIANLPMLTIVPAISAGVPSFFLADSLPETTEIEKRVHKFNSRLSKTLDKIENDHPNVTIYRVLLH
jgi:phospholipase/lecithinase/hemolysin